MLVLLSLLSLCCVNIISADEVLGCGGFVKSHVPIDFSKVIIKLYTKQGALKDETTCAPNNGYYFIPIYDKGEYHLQLESPLGWTFEPVSVTIAMDGKTDLCSQGEDINFVFKGFGIAGRVGSSVASDDDKGPAGVTVELVSARADTPVRSTTTTTDGSFFFTLVYPGDYDIRISHPHWKLSKKQVKIHVSESDTQLPANSLMVAGYDVNGIISTEGAPTSNVHFLLYSQNQKAKDVPVSECLTKNIGPTNQAAFLCYVTSNSEGRFRFPSVPTGSYVIVPQYNEKRRHVYFSPESVEFNVNHDTVQLARPFEIVAFAVTGKVLQTQAGQALANARVFFNDEYVGATDKQGLYHVDRAKAGSYKIAVVHDDFEFDATEATLLLRSTSEEGESGESEVPTLFPARYRICGTVSSEHAQTIAITKIGSTQHVAIASEPSSGTFCHFLTPGQYQFEILDNNRMGGGEHFYPRTQKVEVGLGAQKAAKIAFTQLKAVVQGGVKCFANDCQNIKVILRPTNSPHSPSKHPEYAQEVIQQLHNGSYKFADIRPGTYVVYLTSNRLCWNSEEQDIAVTSFEYTVPDFIQTGYSMSIQSSHDTQLKYQQVDSKSTSEGTLTLQRNVPAKHCLPRAGTYTFKPHSCHAYNANTFTVHTNNPAEMELVLTAVSHSISGYIRSEDAAADYLVVQVKPGQAAGDATEHLRLPYTETVKGFAFVFQLAPNERRTLNALSDKFLFTPEDVLIEGADDCLDIGEVMVASRGKLFAGEVQPALVNVEITLSNGAAEWKTLTDSQGKYRFAPVPYTNEYSLSAHKESYVTTGPDNNGHFHAHKLAEVHVRVLDSHTEQPLQGALVSLSGGESYRRNLQSDKNGFVTFQSLSPSEYFLRPVMKEYNFEPPNHIINVAEGATVNMKVIGKRVAYSAHGLVTSLNNDPEEDVVVTAEGAGNCSQYSEESTSEANGNFRIRGLLPWCDYVLKVHGTDDGLDEDQVKVKVSIQSSDVRSLRLIAFRPCTTTELLVSVSANNVVLDQIRGNIYLKVLRGATQDSGNAAFSTKVDLLHSETLIHVPAVPMDGSTYTVCLETYPQQCSAGKELPEHAAAIVTANKSFHFVRLALSGSGHGWADQYSAPPTSMPTARPPTWYALVGLVCVLSCACAVYNLEWVQVNGFAVLDAVRAYLQRRRSEVEGGGGAPIIHEQIDTSDIDQIVQSINANANTKRRVVKPKRI